MYNFYSHYSFFYVNSKKRNLGFGEKAVIGIFAGGVSAYIGTPAEVALIR